MLKILQDTTSALLKLAGNLSNTCTLEDFLYPPLPRNIKSYSFRFYADDIDASLSGANTLGIGSTKGTLTDMI